MSNQFSHKFSIFYFFSKMEFIVSNFLLLMLERGLLNLTGTITSRKIAG